MARSIEALVKPEMLVWARKSAGLPPQVAAKKIGIKSEKLEMWEKGEIRPTVAQLRRAASVYKRPTAAFYLPRPPAESEPLHDYRRIDRIGDMEYSPALRLELRKARHRRQVAIELMEELDEEIRRFDKKASLRDNPNTLAEEIRSWLGVSVKEQFRWSDHYTALNAWKSAIETLGVLIFQTGSTSDCRIDLEEMRGVSISEALLPVILINSADAPAGRIFTLLHEFLHLLLHSGGICDLEGHRGAAPDEQRAETFCNGVTGAVLVPADYLLSEESVLNKGREKAWSDYELGRLASRFSVSREVILRRLLTLGKTTRQIFEQKRATFRQQDAQQRRSSSNIRPPYYRLIMRNNGLAYTKLVLEAYYQDRITTSEVSGFLGMKVRHLRNVEEAVMQII